MTWDYKQITRRLVEEVINQNRLELVDEFISEDLVDHERSLPPDRRHGKAAFIEALAASKSVVPDLNMTIEEMIAEGDKVMIRVTLRGTHLGEVMGIQPTGRQLEVAGVEILRFQKGKVVEHWSLSDDLAMLGQMGAL